MKGFVKAGLVMAVVALSLCARPQLRAEAIRLDEKATDDKSECYISSVDTDALAVIEAYVTMTGSGSGYHSKIVANAPLSAVSWGIQYDTGAVPPYNNRAMLILENIASNNYGGQVYTRPGGIEVSLGEPVHLMMSIYRNGSGNVYYNGEKAGSFSNPGLVASFFQLACEGCARREGDGVTATFNNVRLRVDRAYNGKAHSKILYKNNPGLNYSAGSSWNNFTISGHVAGLGGGDWDSVYNGVSYVVMFDNN